MIQLSGKTNVSRYLLAILFVHSCSTFLHIMPLNTFSNLHSFLPNIMASSRAMLQVVLHKHFNSGRDDEEDEII